MVLTQKWVSRSQKKSKYILMWNNTVNNDFTMNSQYSILLWNNTGNYCEILVTFFFFPFYDWIRYLPHRPIQSTSNTVGCSSGDNNNSRPLTRPLQASLWLVSGISTCSVFLSASCVPSFQPATDLGQWQTPPRASAVLMPLYFSLPERPCSRRALHPISWGREKVKKRGSGGRRGGVAIHDGMNGCKLPQLAQLTAEVSPCFNQWSAGFPPLLSLFLHFTLCASARIANICLNLEEPLFESPTRQIFHSPLRSLNPILQDSRSSTF